MEDIFLVGQESSDNKLTSSHSQKNSLTNEDDNCFTLSEGQVECDSENRSSKVPLILDIKDLKSGRCLIHKSCPCTSQPIFANSSYLTSTSNGNAPLCIHSAKLNFDSFRIFCRKSSLSSIPSRHTLYGYSPNFKQRMKSRSVCSLTDLIVECSPTVQTGNLLLHPSTGLLAGSVNETLKRKVLMKSAVDFQSVLRDDMKQIMAKTISVSDDKTTDELISHERHFCCSNSNSKSLCQSNSSNSALLQCVWESRHPFFLFSVGKDHGKSIYVASPHDTNSSIDKALDFIYLFHAHTEKIKEPNHGVPNLVAKMKVRSFLLLGSGIPNCTETEFVLSAANEDLSGGLQTFTSSLVKNKELPCRLSEIFRLSRHSRSHSIQKVDGLSSQLKELQELHKSKLGMIDEAGCRKVPFANFPCRLELAAIVVKTFRFARNDGASSGGWGLKFLEKGEDDDASASQASLCSSGSKLNCTEHWRSDINVNVLIPAGIHGGPVSGIAGPSSLIDRWMSNGQCDCGGWDVGCPLMVLNNSEEDSKSLNLTIEVCSMNSLLVKIIPCSVILAGVYCICKELFACVL